MASVGFDSRDASLIVAVKPSGTTATVGSDPIDLGPIDAEGVRSEPFEIELAIPAFTAAELASGTTLAVAIQSSNDPTFAAGVTVAASATIGDGTAYSGGTIRFRPTLKGDRYWRAAVTTTGEPGATATAKEIVLSYVC